MIIRLYRAFKLWRMEARAAKLSLKRVEGYLWAWSEHLTGMPIEDIEIMGGMSSSFNEGPISQAFDAGINDYLRDLANVERQQAEAVAPSDDDDAGRTGTTT